MTSKEALENIKENYPFVSPVKYQQIRDSYIVLEKLVERDTPKKVEIVTTAYYTSPFCPNCKDELNEYYKNNYCKKCGQRLDWNE